MRASTEAIADFGRRTYAGPVAGVLAVGMIFGGCSFSNEEEPVVRETEPSVACAIGAMSYDAEQDTLNMDVSAHGIRGPIVPLGYIATNVRAEKPVGEGHTDLIVDVKHEYSVAKHGGSISIPFPFKEDVNDWHRVLLAVDTKDGQPQYCDDEDFVFKQEGGELDVMPTDEVIVCNWPQRRVMITSADFVDPAKYPSYPWAADDRPDGCP